MKTKPSFLHTWKIAVALVILSLIVAVPLFPVRGWPTVAPKSQVVTLENVYIGSVKLNWAAPGLYSDSLTEPDEKPNLGSIDLGFLANCSNGTLDGYVDLSTTLVFPEMQEITTADGTLAVGPSASGTCIDNNWQVLSERFAQTTGAGQSVERQFQLTGALTAPKTYTGEYRETVWGYGPQSITVVGDFTLLLVNAYILTINAEHGTVTRDPDLLLYHAGDVVTLTPVPADGWHFVKWTDGMAGSSNPAQIIMHGDTTITAVFSNTYTLTYTAGPNGSITGDSPQTVLPGDDGSAVTAVPNTGYRFVKWSDELTDNPRTDTNVTSDIEVTAIFADGITYTVTYNANNATSGIAPADQTKLHGVDLLLAANTGNLARTGYTFNGWNTKSDGSGTHYAAGATYTANAILALYAEWKINTYTVTFNSQGGSAVADQTVNHGDKVTRPADPTRSGYAFNGWYPAASGGTKWDFASEIVTANLTLYAHWNASITPTVSLKPMSHDFGVQMVGTASKPITFTLTNTGSVNLSVSKVAASVDFAVSAETCTFAPVLPGRACTFRVTFSPASTGAKAGKVTVTSNAASSPDSVSLSGKGLVLKTINFRSIGVNDGTVRESSETSELGGYTNPKNQLIIVGDDSLRRQHMGILDFNTATLPDNAIITNVQLRVKVMVLSGGVYTQLGDLTADITKPYFANSVSLQAADFQARALATNVGTFTKATDINQWSTLKVNNNGLLALNLLGHTQFRLHFTLSNSNDAISYQFGFLSGDTLVAVADRPLLVVTYYVP
jgi:uncharacterized repeat protein (TIGR02543 family)